MRKLFITITGTDFKYGSEFLKEGMEVKLLKEPNNKYDSEAIRVELKPLGTIGYVANSTRTVLGNCYSAGRLYDKIGNKAKATILFVASERIIAKVKKSNKNK